MYDCVKMLCVEFLDDFLVHLLHDVSLDLERRPQLAGGHAEVARDHGPLLNLLPDGQSASLSPIMDFFLR
jgi:hypothetical protein